MTSAKQSALPPVRVWRIHLGAHKTATTHLQETLALVRPDLVQRGIDFLPTPRLRERQIAGKLLTSRWARLPLVRNAVVDRIVHEDIDTLRRGPAVVVLSEENLLGLSEENLFGPSGEILPGRLYPRTERVVPRLAAMGRKAEMTFFLSIRSFATLLPSAYAKLLKKSPAPGGGFDALRERALAAPPRWLDLVRRLRRAAPGVPLRIWRQEDYRAHKREIMAALCGCRLAELPDIPEIPPPSRTRSPTLPGLQEAEALPPDLPPGDREPIVNAIYHASDPDGPRFRPFSAAEKAILDAAYAADLAGIDALDAGILMRFPPSDAVAPAATRAAGR